VTAGYSKDAHGPFAKQCQDINDLMEYGLSQEYPYILWESVQQAYSTGKPLLDLWTERAATEGYRVAHVFVNGHTFGNAQCRKRYFYLAYPAHKKFNVSVPEVSPYYPVLHDAIWERRNRDTRPFMWRDTDYDQDSYIDLEPAEKYSVAALPSGWCLNELGRYGYEHLNEKFQGMWDRRGSNMPFSMHCISRINWMRPCPTLTSTSVRLIHPWHHRPCTIGELADIMGWSGNYPVGPVPSLQIAKGVVPAVGEWITQQIVLCEKDNWGKDEWSTRYNHHTGTFEGEDTTGQVEKVIDVSKYYGHSFNIERYPEECQRQCHKYNVNPLTGKLERPWRFNALS
jgi:site-specific DNA-cytosine methylase